MNHKIAVVDRNQLTEYEVKNVLQLLLTSFADKFSKVHLTTTEKLTTLLYFEQQYPPSQTGPTDYIVKNEHEIIGVLSISKKSAMPKKIAYPFELSRTYGFFTIFKYVVLLTALEYSPGDNEHYIENIAVHQKYQKQGIAKALITVAQAEVKKGEKLTLLVSATNQHALRLYLKCGFSIVKKKRKVILGLLANEANWLFMEWGR
ncbi:hypothetical protein ATZ33_16580 [Enterococcus silesiacus]|uniref:N-acetyltransferase domain-containing protein n=1 Tax=Enterococcus silesiacus TaxID=332949 RepID=A0A0S3KFU6_9ENTE|nr:N-acetyltransferase [Enterococcus silesiacus]ALS02937.1 hypothetical protein ATZ33_16580 [Enterococcus silesiacus]OJG91886.1 hypothetical protein RV15_GL000326 [Enterococcus silesiacus]